MRDDDAVSSGEETGIEVRLSFFPLAWVFFFCTPRVAIDGREQPRKWGTHFFPASPGRHDVEIWIPYLFWTRCGYNSKTVEVTAGEATKVNFFMWPVVFLPGSISVSHGQRLEATRTPTGSTGMDKTFLYLVAGTFGAFFLLCCGCCSIQFILGAATGGK
jgi:hypothetical protein